MKTATIATAAALLSTSYAATVTIETTKCYDASIPLQRETIEMNLSGPVARDFNAVCGMRIVSASPGIDINTIQCQAFKDVVGTQPGSALFTYAQPALIATNPVQEKAVRCTYPVYNAKARRQNNDTSSLPSDSVPASTLAATITLPVSSDAASSVAQSTITTTTVASSGVPSSSANGTLSSGTRTPSASQTSASPSQSSGAAATMGVGLGVVAAGLMAMFV